MFEDVLSDEAVYGDPITPNMSVNKTVFQISPEDLAKHENNAVKSLRKYLLGHRYYFACKKKHITAVRLDR